MLLRINGRPIDQPIAGAAVADSLPLLLWPANDQCKQRLPIVAPAPAVSLPLLQIG